MSTGSDNDDGSIVAGGVVDGLEIKRNVLAEKQEDYGYILVATKCFAKGTVILQEEPLLTFKAKDPDDYINKFSTSMKDVKDKILEMAHRPLEDIDQGLKEDGTKLANKYGLDSNEVIIALDVRHTNAFSFGTTGNASLFWCACKANHAW